MNDMDRVIEVLERYLSPLNARAMVERATRAKRFESRNLSARDLREIATSLQRGLRLFLKEPEADQALKEISDLGESAAKVSAPSSVPVVTESDIITARMEARRVCDDLGAKSFAIQKVTTIVSELARNIVSYTRGGMLEITGTVSPGKRRVVVRASDGGPGIPNLSQILAGNYQSKTGLGRGLLGTKRLASHFDINTGSSGTLIVAEIEI